MVGHPDCLWHFGFRARQRYSSHVVSKSVSHQSQPGLQYSLQYKGVADQVVGCVQPAVRDTGVGELRYSERGPTGSAGRVYRRPNHSVNRAAHRTHRQHCPAQHARIGRPCRKAGECRGNTHGGYPRPEGPLETRRSGFDYRDGTQRWLQDASLGVQWSGGGASLDRRRCGDPCGKGA